MPNQPFPDTTTGATPVPENYPNKTRDDTETQELPTPYYQDDAIALYHGDCRELMAKLPDRHAQAIITDPPYTERVHSNSRVQGMKNRNATIGEQFPPITDENLTEIMSELGRISNGWVIANMDYHHALTYDQSPPRD